MLFSVPQQDRTTLSTLNFLRLAVFGLGPALVGIHSLTLRRGLQKVNEARRHNCTPVCCLLLGNMSLFFRP